jgi:hypothetical protein
MVTHMSRKRRSKRHMKRHSKHSKTHIRRNMYRKKHNKTQRGAGGLDFPKLRAANDTQPIHFAPPRASIPVPIQYLPGWKLVHDKDGNPFLISPSNIMYSPLDEAVEKIALENYKLSKNHSEVPHKSPKSPKSSKSPKSPKSK